MHEEEAELRSHTHASLGPADEGLALASVVWRYFEMDARHMKRYVRSCTLHPSTNGNLSVGMVRIRFL